MPEFVIYTWNGEVTCAIEHGVKRSRERLAIARHSINLTEDQEKLSIAQLEGLFHKEIEKVREQL